MLKHEEHSERLGSPQPGELWSLWDMLQEFSPKVFDALQRLQGFGRFLDLHFERDKTQVIISAQDHANLVADLRFLLGMASDWNMPATHVALANAAPSIESLSKGRGPWMGDPDAEVVAVTYPSYVQFGSGIGQIMPRFIAETKGQVFFRLSPAAVAMHVQDSPLFGSAVHNQFKSASYDIEQAGRCMAFGRWTASVLHMMRALEPALLALQTEVRAKTPKDQWQYMIDQIESAIKVMESDRKSGTSKHSRSATKDELAWFSDAATHFRYMKDSWRNYAAHGKEKYDEEAAKRIYNNVRGFMIHLSGKLSEPA